MHPDEVHTGEAGTDDGFHYRMLYVEPSLVREALEFSSSALPFLSNAVLSDTRLMQAVHSAFFDMDSTLEPVAKVELAVLLADGLLANDQSAQKTTSTLIDVQATYRAKEYLDVNLDFIVTAEELEAVTGLTRYALSRQFCKAYGTSPYRYTTMRRLDGVRSSIASGYSLVDAAMKYGFSDQAHMARRFKANYGISPRHLQRLCLEMKN